jgi:hypothetical protein
MALKQTLQQGTVWKDSVTINPLLSDSNMRALLAVYNATGLAARDTVTQLIKVHNYPRPSLNLMELVVDSNLSWIQHWRNNMFTSTGYAFIDSLVALYPNSIDTITHFLDSTVYLIMDFYENYNTRALSSIFSGANGVIYSDPVSIYGDGDSISAIFSNNSAVITYSHGWNVPTSFGCYLGCPYRRYWQFQVDLSDCRVQYLGSSGAVLPQNYFSVNEEDVKPLHVYPNPFSASINLENVAIGSAFRLYAYNGQLVREGLLEQSKIGNLQDLPAGLYFLKIGDGAQEQQVSLVKE